MDDLTDDDEAVLGVLRDEWRANPYLIRQETGLGKGEVNTALNRLARAGRVRQVTRGLYEVTDGGRRPVDSERVSAAIADIEAAAERGDGAALEDALRRAREAIGDG